MSQKNLDIRVRALIGKEMAAIQKHLQEIGALTQKANQATTQRAAAAGKSAKQVQQLAKAEAMAAQAAGQWLNSIKGGPAAMSRLDQSINKTSGSIGRQTAAQTKLRRAIGDSADKQARLEQQRRNQLEKTILKEEAAANKVVAAEARKRAAIMRSIEASQKRFIAGGGSLQDVGAAQVGPMMGGAGIGAAAGVQMSAMATLSQQAKQAGASMHAAGRTGAAGFDHARASAKTLSVEVQNLSRFSQLLRGVLSAFLLYKGFVFLQQQALQFFGALIELEHQVGIVQTQLNHLGSDFRPQIRGRVMEIAGETGAAMEDLAKAEFEVVSANIAVADSFEILELAAKAAISGGLQETELAFNAALSQANAFKKAVSEFDDVYDAQFQVIRRGIFTYEQFATVVGTLSEAFASMGQDIETTNASLAAISQIFTGKQIERGATGLRNAVLRISEAPELFEDMGVQIRDANGDFRNFIDIGRDLNKVLDGMSQSARAAAIKRLFPDERERRGINAFLLQIEEAEQFFIEQKFAAGSLNEAYETVNDSLRQQAAIFRQDIIPSMEPFVSMADQVLTVFNSVNDLLPGINRSLMTTAALAAAIGGAFLMSGGRMQLTQPAHMPMNAGRAGRMMGGMMGSRMPTGLGTAVGGLVVGSQFFSGKRSGSASSGDFLGAALSGGATGAFLGGAPGAAIGASLGVAALALGDAMEKEAPNVAKSFSEALKENLEKDASDITKAITDAALGGGDGEGVNEAMIRAVATTAGTTTRLETRDEVVGRQRFGRKGLMKAGFALGDVFDDMNRAFGGEGQGESAFGALAQSTRRSVSVREGDVAGSAMKLRAGMEEAAEAAEIVGASVPDAVDRAREAILNTVAPLEGLEGAALDEQKARRALAQDIAESQIPLERANELLEMLGSGQMTIVDFYRALRQAEAATRESFVIVAEEFKTRFVGDASLAADVFGRLSNSGDKLAETFGEIARVTQAFSILQQLEEMEVGTVEEGFRFQGSSNIQGIDVGQFLTQAQVDAIVEGLRSQGFAGSIAAGEFLNALVESTNVTTKSLLDEMFGEGAATQAGQNLMDHLTTLLDFEGDKPEIQDLLDAILGEVDASEAIEELQIGANSLAERLFEASEAIRMGLIDGLGFSADQLEMFGEEMETLNKLVFQRSMLDEMRGIAEFADIGTSTIEDAMDILRNEMMQSGRAFFEVMSDPEKLAELLGNMEFGDVSVDMSTDNNITVRFSGEATPGTMAAMEEAIVAAINRANRERMAR